MKLRPVRFEDAEALSRVHALGFDSAWDAAAIAGVLASPGAFGLAAWTANTPDGFILARSIAGEAEVLTIAVDPALRRQGLGRTLLQAGLALAVQAGAGAAFLEVEVGNAAAIGLYERAGFIEVGRRRGYYANGVDALVYRRDLNSRDGADYP